MRNGLADERLGLWHVASMLSCEAWQAASDVALHGRSLRVPPSPFRSGLPQLNHERPQRRLTQVGGRPAHVAVVLAEAQ